MDHTNLQYYWHPQKINRRVARYINFLEDFNYQLKHIPGTHNRADTLSRRPDHNDGSDDNEQIVALPDDLFVKAIAMAMLDENIHQQQRICCQQMENWKGKYCLQQQEDGAWYKGDALMVTEDENFHRKLLEVYHDARTVGHAGVTRTIQALTKDYWWPNI